MKQHLIHALVLAMLALQAQAQHQRTESIDYAALARAQAVKAIPEFTEMLSVPNDAHYP